VGAFLFYEIVVNTNRFAALLSGGFLHKSLIEELHLNLPQNCHMKH
jgi:hypothetical protein